VYKKRNIYAIKAKLAMNAARVLLLLAQATKVAIKLLAFCKVFAFAASTLLLHFSSSFSYSSFNISGLLWGKTVQHSLQLELRCFQLI